MTVTTASKATLGPGSASAAPTGDGRTAPSSDRYRIPDLASSRLDVVRACAALLVMLGHVRGIFFLPYSQLPAQGAAVKALYLITSLGHQAVMVFFVLSGLLIGSSVLRATSTDRWSWRWYLTQRLTRLWIVLVPAICLTLIWDQVGMHLFASTHVYSGLASDRFILPPSVLHHVSPLTVAGNLLFLQTVYVPALGSDGPLWSLSNEFWYYMLFPLLVLTLRRRHASSLFAVLGLLAVAVFVHPLTQLFPVWLLGVGVLLAPRLRVRSALSRRTITALGWALCASALLAGRTPHSPVDTDFLVGAGFAVGLYCLVGLQSPSMASWRPHITAAHSLAGFSYTLYLVHLPALVLLQAALIAHGWTRWEPTPIHVVLALLASCGVTAYAWLIAQATEARTDTLRRYVSGLLPGKPVNG